MQCHGVHRFKIWCELQRNIRISVKCAVVKTISNQANLFVNLIFHGVMQFTCANMFVIVVNKLVYE